MLHFIINLNFSFCNYFRLRIYKKLIDKLKENDINLNKISFFIQFIKLREVQNNNSSGYLNNRTYYYFKVNRKYPINVETWFPTKMDKINFILQCINKLQKNHESESTINARKG